VSFLCKTLDIVKEENPNRTILARLDSGFESDEVMKLLECCGLGYLITMRGTYGVRSTLFGVGPKAWRRVPFEDEGELEVGEFSIERGCWSKPHRRGVLRKRDWDKLQAHLFDRFGWSKSFFVSDRDSKPEDVARFYDKRADVERTISEAKHDLSIDRSRPRASRRTPRTSPSRSWPATFSSSTATVV
jgi:hypothetical protein